MATTYPVLRWQIGDVRISRARYLISRKEWDCCKNEAAGPDREVRNDSLRKVQKAGLADLVESDHHTKEVFLEPAPGHTPGHVSARINSQGGEAVIPGELMHLPVQCGKSNWASRFDVVPDAARRTRRVFLERYADKAMLVLGTHFAMPTARRIIRAGNTFQFGH